MFTSVLITVHSILPISVWSIFAAKIPLRHTSYRRQSSWLSLDIFGKSLSPTWLFLTFCVFFPFLVPYEYVCNKTVISLDTSRPENQGVNCCTLTRRFDKNDSRLLYLTIEKKWKTNDVSADSAAAVRTVGRFKSGFYVTRLASSRTLTGAPPTCA